MTDPAEHYLGPRDWPAGIHASVVQRIGRRIVTGELAPGEILPEQGELSRLLSVSRTVVREATRVLTAKGLVDSRPKRGTVVLPRSSWRILDPDVLTWQTEALLALETGRDDWTVYVRPELVVEIAFDGVQASRRYPGGVALLPQEDAVRVFSFSGEIHVPRRPA